MLYMWKIYRRIMLDVDIILKIIYFVCFPRGQATSVCTEDVESTDNAVGLWHENAK
jgi:hypothetical protein